MRETAILAGGCFWCLDGVFRRVRGVTEVVSGYTGGHTANPDYHQVCSGRTGHAEAVRIVFDPDTIRYEELLMLFFALHDPTTPDRQGHDVGTQYRSAIFHTDDAQAEIARKVIAELDAARLWSSPVVTQVEKAGVFHPAEAYHQNYYALQAHAPYCRTVIAPKIARLQERFGAYLG